MRANSYFRGLVLDDWVPRFHADLHRFMYRQFGTGGFSEDEDSTFRKWRRVEGDGLGLLARLGDRLKDEAFADSVDSMVEEWERALGLSALWGTSREERREVLANLFKAIGAEDAEIEEGVSYLTGTASVIERHLEDVGGDLREMYEYYVKIPETYYRQTYLQLIRFLLERQEPSHTVGYPIVRTEFVTGSEDYGSVKVGPVDEVDVIPFEELESKTERDCVGLVGGQFFLPQGMWLPTNETEYDSWESTYSTILVPSVLFPFIEESGPIYDNIGSVELALTSGSPSYLVHSTGLFAGKKIVDLSASQLKLNIPRGVEL